MLSTPNFVRPEQWQAQIQSLVQQQAQVLVHSSLDENTIRKAHLEHCKDISVTLKHCLDKLEPDACVAVLPQGPLTIPYLKDRVCE